MTEILLYLSWVLIAVGSFFIVIGAFGIFRLPDVFTRIHAAGVIDTVGAAFLLTGLGLNVEFGLVTVKLLMIFLLFFFSSPVATHALAQAALADGIHPVAEDLREVKTVAADKSDKDDV
ncbi:MAG: monovalent cation/H(+) antiporter subunit G [Pseudomonadota bacterium]